MIWMGSVGGNGWWKGCTSGSKVKKRDPAFRVVWCWLSPAGDFHSQFFFFLFSFGGKLIRAGNWLCCGIDNTLLTLLRAQHTTILIPNFSGAHCPVPLSFISVVNINKKFHRKIPLMFLYFVVVVRSFYRLKILIKE